MIISFVRLLKYRYSLLPLLIRLEVFILRVVYFVLSMGRAIVFFILTFIVVRRLVGLILILSQVTNYGNDTTITIII